MKRWFVLLSLLALSIAQNGDFNPCGNEQPIAFANKNYDHQVAYNSANNEYFVVWIEELTSGITGVSGRRLARDGTSIGGKFAFTTATPARKSSPTIHYNPRNGWYFLTFEVENGPDFDIVAGAFYPNGTIAEPLFYLVALEGEDDKASFAYNSDLDQYLFTWENDIYDNVTNQLVTSNVFLAILNGRGRPVYNYAQQLTGIDHDSSPHAAYNPVRREFVVTLSLPEYLGATFKNVEAYFVSEAGIFNPNGSLVGALSFGPNNTRISCHDSTLIWAPLNQYFFLTYEVDIDGDERFNTDIVSSPIDPANLNALGIVALGGTLPRNRRHNAVYASRTNDFVVSYEVDTPGDPAVNIRGVVLSANSLNRYQEIEYINRQTQDDHHPRLAYNSNEGVVLAVWFNGTEVGDNVTKRSVSEFESSREGVYQPRTGGRNWNGRVNHIPFNLGEQYQSSPVDDSRAEERQVTSANFIKGTLLCASSSSLPPPTSASLATTTTPATSQLIASSAPFSSPIQDSTDSESSSGKKGSNSGVVAGIAVVVVIFGLAAIGFGAALVYVLVIKPRRKANKAQRFDPE